MNKSLTLCLVLSLGGPAIAQSGNELVVVPSQSSIRTYVLKDGKSGLRAEIKKVQGNVVYMKIYRGAATYDDRKKLDEFQPVSQFRIMQAVTPPEDAKAQGDLIRFALAKDLPNQARYQLRVARRTTGNPKFGEEFDKEIRAKAAAKLEAEFHDNLKQGKIHTAQARLREIDRHYADVVSESTRNELKASLEQGKTEFAAAAAERHATEATAREAKEFHRKLNPLRRRMEQAINHNKQGLRAGKSMGTALRRFRAAERDFDYTLRGCDKLEKKYGNAAKQMREITYVRETSQRELTNALLNSASIYTTRGSYNNAMGNVNKVLSYDPNNTRALSQRGRIETAAAGRWY